MIVVLCFSRFGVSSPPSSATKTHKQDRGGRLCRRTLCEPETSPTGTDELGQWKVEGGPRANDCWAPLGSRGATGRRRRASTILCLCHTQPSSEARLGLCPGPPAPSLPPPSTKLGQYTCAPRLHRTFARHTLAASAAVTWSLTIPLACDGVERWCGKEGGKEEDRGGPRSRGLGHAAAHRLCPLCHSPHHHTSHPATGRHGGAPSDPQTMEGLEEA